ncbi:unnamed protein product [Sphacelaria rigidula]
MICAAKTTPRNCGVGVGLRAECGVALPANRVRIIETCCPPYDGQMCNSHLKCIGHGILFKSTCHEQCTYIHTVYAGEANVVGPFLRRFIRFFCCFCCCCCRFTRLQTYTHLFFIFFMI